MSKGLKVSLVITPIIIGIVIGVYSVNQRLETKSRASQKEDAILPTSMPKHQKEDFNGDGVVDELDFEIFIEKYTNKDSQADLNGSGSVNSLDYNLFVSKME